MVEIVNETPIAVKDLLSERGDEERTKLTEKIDVLVKECLHSNLANFMYLITQHHIITPRIGRFRIPGETDQNILHDILPRNYRTDNSFDINIIINDITNYIDVKLGIIKGSETSEEILPVSQEIEQHLSREKDSLKSFDKIISEYLRTIGLHHLRNSPGRTWDITMLQNDFKVLQLNYKKFIRHYQLDDGRIVKCSIGPNIATMEIYRGE